MIKKSLMILLLGVSTTFAFGQKTDTVIVDLTKTSKITFTIKDRKDLETLENYDYQKLFQDIIAKLKVSDSTLVLKKDSDQIPLAKKNRDNTILELPEHKDDDNKDDKDEKDDNNWHNWYGKRYWGNQRQSLRVDLGTNNYISNGKFPDQDNASYAVRPLGSWYVAINSVRRTRMNKNLVFEWGAGVSWYNFKFQDKSTFVQKTNDNVNFMPDSRGFSYIKSKLSATYLNASFIPMLEFGERSEKTNSKADNNRPFRIGIGPYIGYRIASHSKLVYDDANHHTQKDKNNDNFYLNNFRYGARLQVGFWNTDLFFNYDLNELFSSGKGPNLNAFSFGIVF